MALEATDCVQNKCVLLLVEFAWRPPWSQIIFFEKYIIVCTGVFQFVSLTNDCALKHVHARELVHDIFDDLGPPVVKLYAFELFLRN